VAEVSPEEEEAAAAQGANAIDVVKLDILLDHALSLPVAAEAAAADTAEDMAGAAAVAAEDSTNRRLATLAVA